MVKGLWQLKGTDLYTNRAADVIIDRQTDRKYVRGERILFRDPAQTPTPIEEQDPNRWLFKYEGYESVGSESYIREIGIQTIFRK